MICIRMLLMETKSFKPLLIKTDMKLTLFISKKILSIKYALVCLRILKEVRLSKLMINSTSTRRLMTVVKTTRQLQERYSKKTFRINLDILDFQLINLIWVWTQSWVFPSPLEIKVYNNLMLLKRNLMLMWLCSNGQLEY